MNECKTPTEPYRTARFSARLLIVGLSSLKETRDMTYCYTKELFSPSSRAIRYIES